MDLTKLQAQLMVHEGYREKPYTDTVGKVTIGIGHNLTDVGLTHIQVIRLYNDDLAKVMAFVTRTFPWFNSLDDVRQRAFVDMVFNLQEKVLGFKHMLNALAVGDWNTAADELLNSKFAVQTGKRATDLAHMIRTGTDI